LSAARPSGLLNDLGGLEQHVVGDGQAEGLSGFEVDNDLESHRLLNGQIRWLSTVENLMDVTSGLSKHPWQVGTITSQAADIHKFAQGVYGWQAGAGYKLDDAHSILDSCGVRIDDQSASGIMREVSEGTSQVAFMAHWYEAQLDS
jgi:hypothetical protein